MLYDDQAGAGIAHITERLKDNISVVIRVRLILHLVEVHLDGIRYLTVPLDDGLSQ